MTTLAVAFGVSLVARWVYLWLEWSQGRAHRQMLRGVAAWKLEQRKLRSRTPGGSIDSDGGTPQSPSGRTGVEPTAVAVEAAPPVREALVGARLPHAPAPTRHPQTTGGCAPAALHAT